MATKVGGKDGKSAPSAATNLIGTLVKRLLKKTEMSFLEVLEGHLVANMTCLNL